MELSPKQAEGVDWLYNRPRSYLADPPGFGKSRQVLGAAAHAQNLLIVAPAAIRDMGVWQTEVERVQHQGDYTVWSYHSLPRLSPAPDSAAFWRKHGFDAVVFDEAHHLKNRKVSWGSNALHLAKRLERVHLASGTPVPNRATELWGQLRLVRLDIPAYNPWVNRWFKREPNPFNPWNVPGNLHTCLPECRSKGWGREDDPPDCPHWLEFIEAEMAPWMLSRDEADLDLPPMTGAAQPLWCPMVPAQKRAYKALAQDYYVDLGDGKNLEAITQTDQYVQLMKLSTGLECLDPELEGSGKLKAVEALLESRRRPTLVVCYYNSTAHALVRLAQRLGHRVGTIGAKTSPKQRGVVARAFQDGAYDTLVASISVVAEGVTLTAADEIVMVERHWAPHKNEQAIKRIHRRGQTRPCTVRQLVTPGTEDEHQWKDVYLKQVHIDRVMQTPLLGGT